MVGMNEPALPLRLKILASAIFGLATLAVVAYFVHFPNTFSSDQGVWGQFGDYIGGLLNPLLSVPAFFAILYTIKLQVDTIRIQQNEVKSSADALAAQLSHADTTLFDSRLFQLVDLQKRVLSELYIYRVFIIDLDDDPAALSPGPYVGDRGIAYMWKEFLENELGRVARGSYSEPEFDAIQIEFDSWLRNNWKHIGKYVKNFANTLRHISLSINNPGRQGFALDVVRANLGQDEQNLLFYFLIFSSEFDSCFPLFVTGKLLVDGDDRDPFLGDRSDFIDMKSKKLFR